MYPKRLDTIYHEGSVYAFSIRNNLPSVLKGSVWLDLSGYNFVKVSGKKGTWQTVPKELPGKPHQENVVQQGYVNFSVSVNIGGQVLTYEVNARDEKQVERLAWGRLSQDLKMPIPAVRARLLPDSMNIKRT